MLTVTEPTVRGQGDYGDRGSFIQEEEKEYDGQSLEMVCQAVSH